MMAALNDDTVKTALLPVNASVPAWKVNGLRLLSAMVLKLLAEPIQPAQAIQALLEVLFERQKIAHVVERVLDLLLRHGSACPIRARVGFGELHAQ